MVLLAILAVVALAAFGLVIWTLRSAVPRDASFEQLENRIHEVDLPAFQNLVDPAETVFLATSLSPRVFRRVQRQRILAAVHYLYALSGNAAILMRMGDLASHSDDAAIADSGRALSSAALHTRLLVLRAYCFLIPQLLFPSAKPEWFPGILAHYDELKRCLVHLVSMQQPSMTSRSVRII